MPTAFYLRNLTAANPPSNGEKSTALPVGTFSGNSGAGFEDLALKTAKGTAQASKARSSLAQTAHQDNYIARFTSDALAAQTIAAATWTLAVAVSEANTNANSFTILSCYVWRPSTSSVVGFIRDSDITLGVEWGATEDGQVVTFSGSAVTVQANDVLVLEFWRHAAQAMAAAYAQTLYFDGATDVTDTTSADAASYLQNPNTITFATATVQKSSLDTGSGAEVNLKQRNFSAAAEAGAGAEANLKERQLGIQTDTGSGTEANVKERRLGAQTDAGTGTEAQLKERQLPSSDAGSGVEANLKERQLPSTDTASGAEAQLKLRALGAQTDSGSAAETQVKERGLATQTDSATGAEAQSVGKTSAPVQKSSSDSGVGADDENIERHDLGYKESSGYIIFYTMPSIQLVRLRGSFPNLWRGRLRVRLEHVSSGRGGLRTTWVGSAPYCAEGAVALRGVHAFHAMGGAVQASLEAKTISNATVDWLEVRGAFLAELVFGDTHRQLIAAYYELLEV